MESEVIGKPMRAWVTAVVTLLLLTAPLAVRAQQPAAKTARLGFLSLGAAVEPSVFVQRLRELGYSEKEKLAIEYRFAEGRREGLEPFARELVGLRVDVIMALGDEAIVAARKVTTTIPIVMLACDALTVGFVTSLARPGGNVTGVTCLTTELSQKRVALLRETVPRAMRLGLLYNPANPAKPLDADRIRKISQTVGMKVQSQEVLERADLEKAFSAFARDRAEAVIVLDEALLLMHAKLVAELAIKHHLPTMHAFREAVAAGGLMSYGPSLAEMLHIAATHVAKILDGARPGDLPVEQPTKFELVINLKTAKALGLTIPPAALLRADQVLE
jgi:putative ABC transport system substrate-binding protein